MDKAFTTPIKWIIFTLISMVISYCFTGISVITLGLLITGFLFSVAYLYKEYLFNDN